MNTPHGGKLINRLAYQKAIANHEKSAAREVEIDRETFNDIENIACGIYSPLTGFLGKEDFQSCLNRGRLKNNLPWTIPIVFDILKDQFKVGQKLLLKNGKGRALFQIKEIFGYSKTNFAKKIFGTTDPAHPGMQKIHCRKDYLAAGPIFLLAPSRNPLGKFAVTPAQTRTIFKKLGWKTIAAFQTRNVPHIGHEYLQKTALNICDGLLINPVIGKKKEGDFKDDLIIKTYRALIKHYFPKENVLLGSLHYEMQYAGPREAIHHAIMRKNLGCTHFIVGRDHAGVGSFYHPFAAHEIFKKYPDLGITPIFFSSFFHCNRCLGIASEKTCPHINDRVEFKGTMLRNIIGNNELPPHTLMRPEITSIIQKHPKPFV